MLEGGRDGDDVEGRGAGIFRLYTVGDDGGQIAEESLKTVHRQIVLSALAVCLRLRRGGALGRRDYRGAQFLRELR